MAEHPNDPSQPTFVDLPQVTEIFADSAPLFNFDGKTLRILFAVTRPDTPVAGQPMTAKQYPCARLVLPADVGLDLIDKLAKMVQSMIQQGVLKPVMPMAQDPSKKPN